MKLFVPSGLLLAAMFVAGCNTAENRFMAGDQPVAAKPVAHPKRPAPVAKVVPPRPVAPVLIVAPQKPAPSVVVVNAPPMVVATNAAPVAPTMVPDDPLPAATKPADVPAAPAAVGLPTIITPDTSLAGNVVAYNSAARFVVLSFPAGPMPGAGQKIFLYRGGLKVGEIKITGPQRDNHTVGDLVTGDAQAGDEARDQ